MTSEGKCVGRHNNIVIFVDGVAPGDVVDVKITEKKKNMLYAKPVKFIRKSAVRQEPFCQHYRFCGGCKWQHVTYQAQLENKQNEVYETLTRLGHLENLIMQPILAAPSTAWFRNKLDFACSNHRWLLPNEVKDDEVANRNAIGFHVPGRFDKVVHIDYCYLQYNPVNKIKNWLHQYALNHQWYYYDSVTNKGFLRSLMVRTTTLGQTMVLVQFAQPSAEIEIMLEALIDAIPIDSVYYTINNKGNDTIYDLDVINYHGKPYIIEQLEDLEFEIGPKTFFQTNTAQALNLYKLTRQLAGLTGTEIVYDLYSGAGSIGLFIARNAKQVFGIESVPMAVADAHRNAMRNNITNTAYFAGDMREALSEQWMTQNGYPDVVITDPPRNGMHPDVCTMLNKCGAKRIVYISCNPATQARDLALLDNYKITYCQPVDMFPQTAHVECIVRLELK